ncbi:MAG: prepilin peptidase [Bryobacteraceae bacterium]
MTTALRILLAVFAIASAAWDLHSRRIPNWLTVGAFAAGLVLQAIGFGWSGVSTGLMGVGVALAITVPLFALRALGGGDVKLMAATAAMTGAMPFITVFVINAVVGGVAAIALALYKGRLKQTLSNTGAIVSSIASGRAPHEDRPELDISRPQAITLPRGAIFGVCALLVAFWG